ncbi:hypothetical protein B0H10DRAFT_1815351 [Mycena sp. CBHHK59/15]|nr:hypothetical protein B0H10DRAFT_1815351 [Mycena sp. CBHHK59/15]
MTNPIDSILGSITSTNHNLPPFHDGPTLHIHQKCANCLITQRTHGTRLFLCKSCGVDMYCSKECQVAHWPSHKQQCKYIKKERAIVAEKSKIPSAVADLQAWMTYYDTPLRNCAIACMRLPDPDSTHMERKAMFYLQLYHKGDPSLPVWDRFRVLSVGRRDLDDLVPLSTLRHSQGSYSKACERGKIELGSRFYGVIQIGISALFGPEHSPAVAERLKQFSIDKVTAHAKIVRQDWWILFREYVAVGAKTKFCCGKIPGMDDVCCCGGWVHDAEKRVSRCSA